MKGARPNGTNERKSVESPLGWEMDVSEESRYVIVYRSYEVREGTRLLELLTSMYVSGHH